jgi:hypothetical protein
MVLQIGLKISPWSSLALNKIKSFADLPLPCKETSMVSASEAKKASTMLHKSFIRRQMGKAGG